MFMSRLQVEQSCLQQANAESNEVTLPNMQLFVSLESNEAIEVKRRAARVQVGQHADSIGQNFSNHTMREVPEVMYSDASHPKSLRQMRLRFPPLNHQLLRLSAPFLAILAPRFASVALSHFALSPFSGSTIEA